MIRGKVKNLANIYASVKEESTYLRTLFVMTPPPHSQMSVLPKILQQTPTLPLWNVEPIKGTQQIKNVKKMKQKNANWATIRKCWRC